MDLIPDDPKAFEQYNKPLEKYGWELKEIARFGVAHIDYKLERYDGHTANVLQEIPELLLRDIQRPELYALCGEAGLVIDPMIALRMLLVVKAENVKTPPTYAKGSKPYEHA